MRRAMVILSLCLSACSNGPSADAAVSAAQRAAIHADLRSKHGARGFLSPSAAAPIGCAELILGATETRRQLAVYLVYTCGTWDASCPSDAASGSSAAAVVHVQGNTVERWQFPGDGSQYTRDIKAWFPKSLRESASNPGAAAGERLGRDAFRDAGCRQAS
jgi:hypothetical protein